jgi:Uma2 family endonuclease
MEKTLDLATPTIYYPESDGQPMGETDFHITTMLYLRQALRYLFRQAEQTYVAANMFFYYEEGVPSACKAPDVFVVKGIAKHDRRIYQLWVEQVVPCTIIEITSRATRLEDMGTKRGLYEFLGVKEYILFDPLSEYLSPQLQGFHLVDDFYQPMPLTSEHTLYSQELAVIFQPEGVLLRVIEPTTGEVIPTLDEAVDQIQTVIEQAQTEMKRAETEAKRAETEAKRAETEAKRAEAAEREVARLKAELEQLRRQATED